MELKSYRDLEVLKEDPLAVDRQRRLSNLLKTARNLKGLSRAETAKLLGSHPQKILELESEKIPHRRFASCLDFLKAIAQFADMPVKDFVGLIEGTSERTTKTGHLARELYVWESVILDYVAKARVDRRDKLIEAISVAFDGEQKLIDKKLSLICLLLQADEDFLDSLAVLLKRLG